jgi:hypothetical protein
VGWTPEQARELANTGRPLELLAETAKVQNAFARQNPGYELIVSPLRSLEKQVRLWNGNHTVGLASEKLWKQMVEVLGEAHQYPDPPTGPSIAKFKMTLHDAMVTPEPSSAAPGISDHGRMQAVDLVVAQDGDVIAGTDTKEIATKWQHDGWGKKLIKATAGTRLVGPLKHPFEPWHWTLGT